MANDHDAAPLSDADTAEKPVREQLKKASIAGLPSEPTAVPSEPVQSAQDAPAAEPVPEDGKEVKDRGRLQRKRSYDEVEDMHGEPATSEPVRLHTRKRSRDSTVEEELLNNGQRKGSGERPRDADNAEGISATNGEAKSQSSDRPGTPEAGAEKRTEAAVEAMASPKTKRSRLHSTTAEKESALAAERPSAVMPATEAKAEDSTTATGTSVESSSASAETSAPKIPPTSGFANTSAVSPFGALAGSKSPSSEPPQTSSSAFASSGFGSLASSSTSGFGAIGKTAGGFGSGGSFATGGKSPLAAQPSQEKEKPKETASSTFGGALGKKSAFDTTASTSESSPGAASSGFGKLGASTGGFGSALGGSGFGGLGGSGGLTSFASGKPSSVLGSSSKAAKPFGAHAADDNEAADDAGDEDDAGFKSPLSQGEEDKQDERFYAQQVETGEEDEETEYSCRAKLYNYAAVEDGRKEWRERGLGVLRLNVRKPAVDDPEGKVRARFLMRADGSHRVVLNTPVKKELKFGAAGGGPPQGGLMLFMGTIDGKTGLEMLQLKMRQQFALELHEKIVELQEEM